MPKGTSSGPTRRMAKMACGLLLSVNQCEKDMYINDTYCQSMGREACPASAVKSTAWKVISKFAIQFSG
jgi:hypothetical protein